MKKLPIIHPATNCQLPEVVLTIREYAVECSSVELDLDYSKLNSALALPTSPRYEVLLAKSISNQAILIGWWIANLYQLDVHPTSAWSISRRFKVVVGPFSHGLKRELTRLSLSSYAAGKSNGEPTLIEL
ncbi:hypothetical protein ASL83_003310 [Vibrio parahaemolyticus]|nr:hypothetical protein [Vibrio parahaemolyticus]